MNHRFTPNGRRAAVLLGPSVLLLTCSLTGSAAAAAGADSPALHTFGPIAVGVPDLDPPAGNEAGGVDLFLDDGSIQVLTEAKLGLPGDEDFSRFGSAVAIADLNGDKYPDLVVGAPGNRVDGSTTGHVDVLLGSADGITSGRATRLPSPAKTGDEFGAAVVVSAGSLWVGAPGSDVAATNDGAVYRYAISKAGKATLSDTLTESTMSGTIQAGERLGEVLAPADDGVVIGIPKRKIGAAAEAGQIARIRVSANNKLIGEVWDQNSPKVPGAAEAGDHFGAAVSRNGYVVGVPGEDVGTLKDAGAVQTFAQGFQTPKMTPGPLQSQDSPGIPGAVEAGDQYGAAVAVGIFDCQETFQTAVGAPGEDIGRIADAGSVTLYTVPTVDSPNCTPRALAQGTGLPGAAEAGDATGKVLAASLGNPDSEEDQYDVLLVGAPGEDIGTARSGRDTGRAMLRAGFDGYTQAFGSQSGDWSGLAYGSTFGS